MGTMPCAPPRHCPLCTFLTSSEGHSDTHSPCAFNHRKAALPPVTRAPAHRSGPGTAPAPTSGTSSGEARPLPTCAHCALRRLLSFKEEETV